MKRNCQAGTDRQTGLIPAVNLQFKKIREENDMITATVVFLFMLLLSVISVGIKLAWGATKFIFGLGLFWLCPLLFIIIVLLGGFTHMWIPILIVGLLFGRGYRRI